MMTVVSSGISIIDKEISGESLGIGHPYRFDSYSYEFMGRDTKSDRHRFLICYKQLIFMTSITFIYNVENN